MKVYYGSGGVTPRILNVGTRWSWVVSFTPRPLYPQGKIPWYPVDRRLGGPQNRSGRGGEEKNCQTLPGLEPPIIQPVAQRYTTELYWLLVMFIMYVKITALVSSMGALRPLACSAWNHLDTPVGFLRREIGPYIAKPLPTQDGVTQKKRGHISMPRAGFEPTIPVFERSKTIWASDRTAKLHFSRMNKGIDK
jgi:hypothetical protein